MSLRLLRKELGAEAPVASAQARAVVQPAGRGRGGGYPSRGAPSADIGQRVEAFIKESDIDERTADALRDADPAAQQAVLERGTLSNTRDPSQVLRARLRAALRDVAPEGGDVGGGGSGGSGAGAAAAGGSARVIAPQVVGGFRGSTAQAAHIAATKKAAADSAREKEQDWKNASEVAVRSGLGLQAVEERKQREEEERQAKREALRAKRKGEATKREADEARAIEECEEQAWCDSEAHERVKYEAALIVRIATRFGAAGVWTKISEARTRGAEIPLDARKVYLLAHPDKCPMPEAVDATAILNAQRPPEMSESRAGPASGAASGAGSREAAGARVAAARSAASRVRKTDPEDGQACTFEELLTKYDGTYSHEELQKYWEDECQALEESAPEAAPANAEDEARRQRLAARMAARAAEVGGGSGGGVAAPAARTVGRTAPPPVAAAAAPRATAGPARAAEAPSGAAQSARECVPGLAAWLQIMHLGQHVEAVARWADEQGALSLEELVENVDDICSDLQLKSLECRRLKQGAEAAAAQVSAATAEAPPEEEGPAEADVEERELAGSDALHEARSEHLDVERDLAAMAFFGREEEEAAPPPRPALRPRAAAAADPPSASRAAAPREAAAPAATARGSAVGGTAAPAAAAAAVAAAPPSEDGPEERRRDPESGQTLTLRQLHQLYAGQYTAREIEEYWGTCEPAGAGAGAAGPPRGSAPAPAAAAGGAPTAHWGAGQRRRF